MGPNCGYFPLGMRALTIPALFFAGLLGACSSSPGGAPGDAGVQTAFERTSYEGPVASNRDFGGLVVAEEPQAALIGREILEKGGSAGDAATAIYFTLAVTYPVAAGLGGGGACLAFGQAKGAVDAIDFTQGATTIPANARGMALLHARHGVKRWTSVVGPAERLAGKGFPASRSLVKALDQARAVTQLDPAVAQLFSGPGGRPLKELDHVTQIGLATTLGRLRGHGVRGVYAGIGAQALVDGARDAGLPLSAEVLAAYRPTVSPAPSTPLGDRHVHTMVNQGAAQRAPANSATTFLAVDRNANAVLCAVGMGAPLGSGRLAKGTGIVLADPSTPPAPFSGALVINTYTKELFFAGVAAGSGTAAQKLLALAQTSGLDTSSPPGTSIHALTCPSGLTPDDGKCQLAVSPNTHGLGLQATTN